MPKDIANSLSADFVMKSKSGTGNGYAILNGTQLYHRILIKKNFEINPEQFEIIGMCSSAGYTPEIVGLPKLKDGDARPLVNGKNLYARVYIRRKK